MELATKQGFKQTEVGLIPEDWEIKRFGDLSQKIIGGGTPSRSNKLFWGNEIPWVTVKDFSSFNPLQTQEYITYEGLKNSASHLIPTGIIITSTRMALGKAVIYDVDVSINQDLKAIYPKKNIYTKFIYYWFQFNSKYLEGLGSGSTVMGLSLTDLKKIQVKLPPTLKEQKAIATALSDVDDLIASLENLIAKKQAIKQGAMQQLLTPPHKGGKRLPGFSGEWVEKKLGEKADFYKGKGLPKSDIIEEGKYKCIHYGELFTNYNHIITSVRSRTNENSDIFLSKENDVLMPTSDVTPNGLATASALFEDDIILGGDVLVIRPNKSLYGAFLSYQISMNKQQIMSLISGTTVYHLYGSDMSKFNFHIPKIDEQKAIIRILYDMEVEITQLETKKAKYQQLKQGMLQELLTGNTRLV
ncbi:restriction endonuclease subunit S [Tenacibaculum maritimum]|uniref:restriction endonuclease subunit S n=1 Tax=Tenacibaculum maritimum TaxID=107401 RepID=UPI0012E58464|nr:restriction endonuclease subunit S [Tenacibaculum maritimum]CAA0149992.1 Type I restriction-modification enzyme S subunit, HsdS family [Tenacibaculum maritimum]